MTATNAETDDANAADSRPRRSRRTGFRFEHAKNFVVPFMVGASRRTPAWLMRTGIATACGLAKPTYFVPGNPLRRAAKSLERIARQRGLDLPARRTYFGLFDQAQRMASLLTEIRSGSLSESRLRELFRYGDGVEAKIADIRATHGGIVGAVPHTFSSLITASALSRDFDTLAVSRDSRSNDRAKISREVFTTLGIEPIWARRGNPVRLALQCTRALTRGTILIATLDNVYRYPHRIEVEMFGVPVGMNPWAARIAARTKAPIVPAFSRMEDGQAVLEVGDPLISDDPKELIQHYCRYFEEQILASPSSWAFLGDKRWGRKLRDAVASGE